MQPELAAQIAPNYSTAPNPCATTLNLGISSAGADMKFYLYPRSDGAATGYVLLAINTSTTTSEGAVFTPNEAVTFTSFESRADMADNTTTCPGFTADSADRDEYHTCGIGVTVGPSPQATYPSLYYNSGAPLQAPGSVRLYSLTNGVASTASSPPPVPVGATPTPLPSVSAFPFPSDFPARYQPLVNALLTPAPFTTPFPVPTGTVLTLGTLPTCAEMAPPYYNYFGRKFVVAYCPDASPNPTATSFTATVTYGGGLAFQTIVNLIGPTPSPTSSACHSPLTLPQGSTYYGICVAQGSQVTVIPIDAPPTPNPAPTYSAYPGMLDTTCGASGTYMSQVGGPFPPASKQCMFLSNPMNGIIPPNAQPDPNDAAMMTASDMAAGPHPLGVVGTIQGGNGNYAFNWVNAGSPSVPVNETCSGLCGTMTSAVTWLPQDMQVQGATDCHAEEVYFAQQIVEDFWTVDACSPFQVYQGQTISTGAATRLPMSSDGTGSTVTASAISPALGMIRGESVLDTRVATYETTIQFAPDCTSKFYRYPAKGSDGGAGNAGCDHANAPPDGAFMYYQWNGARAYPYATIDTLNHILSCNLDPPSTKYWASMTLGYGHGGIISDSNGNGGHAVYVQTSTDRNLTRFGVASAWLVIATETGTAISNGSYQIPISHGASNCIVDTDMHFLSPLTPPVPGTTIGIPIAP